MNEPFYEVWHEKSARVIESWKAGARAFHDSVVVRPSAVLSRHFFRRLFQNDVFPFEEQMKEKLYILLAMVAALGWLMANSLFSKYMFLEDLGESWLEKFHFILFFMLFMAFATVLEWDILFLDRRDYTNLMPLPVRLRTIFLAKFGSFFIFVFFLSAAVNSLSLMAPAFFLVRWISNRVSALVMYAFAQIVAVTAAFIFVFFLFVFVASVLLVVLSPRLFKAVSLGIRFALLAGIIFFLMMFLGGYNTDFFARLSDLKSRNDPALLAFPPIWFTGLYEVLIGRGNPVYAKAAILGFGSILVLVAGSFGAMALSYRKHARRTLEERPRFAPFKGIRARLSAGFDSIFLRNPIERAVFHFFGTTLANSPLHKMRLAGYLAFAVGLILILTGALRTTLDRSSTANLNLLSAPLILAFFLLVGLRSLVNVPIAAEASWAFRMTEAKVRKHYFIALKKAIFFLALVPISIVLFALFGALWGAGPAALHALYGLTFAVLLREILFWRYSKIPFACRVVPGKSRLQSFWLIYILGFMFLISGFSALERGLFSAPAGFIPYFAGTISLWVILSLVQRRFVYEKLQIVYEERPEPALITLE
jgi:hypothetical protein